MSIGRQRKHSGHTPGAANSLTSSRDAKHPARTRNPFNGPILSDMVSGRGKGRVGNMDSRGSRYAHVPSGQKKGAGS